MRIPRNSLLCLCMIAMPVFLSGPSLSAFQLPAAPNSDSSGSIAIPLARAANSYAIYSLLMPGGDFSRLPASQNRRWAIADTTINETDRNPAVPPQGQLKPPPENPTAFEEAVNDYQARKYERVRLTRDFHLNHDYSLLNADEIAELRTSRSAVGPSSASKAKYAGYPGITFFSEVYFNSSQTAALVYMNDWCGSLCSSGQWIYLEKHGGNWVRRSGITAKTS